MFLDPEEINTIRNEIIDGVKAARRGDIVCDYPDNFTVSRMVGGNLVTATFPIWTDRFPKIKEAT